MLIEPLTMAIVFGLLFVSLVAISAFAYWHGVRLSPLYEKRARLIEDIEIAQTNKAELEAELKQLGVEKAAAERRIAEGKEAEEFLKRHESEIANKRAALESLNQVIKKSIDARNDEAKKLGDLRTDVAKASGELEALRDKKNELQNNFDNLHSEKKRLEREKEDLEKDIEKLERQQKSASDACASYQSKLEKAKDECRSKMQELEQAKEDCRGEMRKLNQVKDENKTLATENRALQSKRIDLGLENEALNKKKAVLVQEAKDLQEKINNYSFQKGAVEQQLRTSQNNLNQTKEALNKTDKDLLERRQELQILKNRCDALREDEEKLRKGNKKLETEKVILEEDIKNNSRRISANEEEKWRDLNRPLPALNAWRETKRKGTKAGRDEQSFLETFKDRLKDCGITFHDRAIHAFHTGLKVADSSPLVVLAGISGTGKSLLPRLYAQAAGMTFHQIAVQPRWDNPQDMFGFYNYMEGRYKATELSRLLWQCDIWNNVPAARNDFGSADGLPMNLVLLDEMNLAKVEYYFSDLLSKLEVRRDVLAEDPRSRAPAEIELEGGSNQKDKDAGKRLFVAWNTLFVGTMNEDESTQSLSDKALDRSNVLRFGRPKAIAANPDVFGFQEKCRDDARFMDYEAWKDWFRTPDGQYDIKQEEADAINKINDALADVGRPFAFRVFSSIRSYLANYPDQTQTGRQAALADQIEMKVLPKLNGLDKQSSSTEKALKDIEEVLEQQVQDKDKELLEAFRAAKDNQDDTIFQWRGVTR